MDVGLFRWIWRFNAVAIAGVMVIAGVIGAAGIYRLVQELTSERFVPNLVNVDPQAETATSERLLAFHPLDRTGLLWARIERATSTPLGVSSKYASATADYLIYDPAAGASRALLGLKQSMISEARLLYAPNADSETRPALAMQILYVDRDTDGDDRLTERDEQVLALARPDGTGLTELARAARTLGIHAISTTEAVAMIETEGRVEALHLDLTTRAITKRAPITR